MEDEMQPIPLQAPQHIIDGFRENDARLAAEEAAKKQKQEAARIKLRARLDKLKKPPKSKLPRQKGSWFSGGWDMKNPYEPPPLPINKDGIVKEPIRYSPEALTLLKDDRRHSHFLHWYNFSCGSETIAMQEAGIRKKTLDLWKENKYFRQAMQEIRNEIADRMIFKLVESAGLTGKASGKASETTILKLLQMIKPDAFASKEEPEREKPKNETNGDQSIFTHKLPRPGKAKEGNGAAEGS